MKKSLFLSVILCAALASGCFAIGAGVGTRAMGMGGTGIATATDITSAYFNPAGLQFGADSVQVQAFAGGDTQGLADLIDAVSNGEDFITNNFDKDFNLEANISGGAGLAFKKIGLSVLADGVANFQKADFAKSLKFNINGDVNGYIPLTLGSSFSTPGLPIASLAVGVNLKSITVASMYTNVAQTSPTTGAGTMSSTSGTGFGFDVGVAAKITPLVTAGAVVRNLSASTVIKTKTTPITVLSTGEIIDGTEIDNTTTYTPPVETGIGISVLEPITNILIACDVENYSLPDNGNVNKSTSYSDTHIGFEKGFLLNTFMLRAGYYTYGPTSDTFYTYGLGVNMGPASIGVAAANSVKDSVNSVASAQIGVAF